MSHILVVEDDSALQKVYEEVLKKEGYDVTVVDTGEKALTQLKQDEVKLVLLDIMIPGSMNGFDLLSRMKRDEGLAAIPVIVMTNLDAEKQTGLDMGAIDYFIKADMPLHHLVEIIKKHLPPNPVLS